MKIGFAFLCRDKILNQDLWSYFFNSLNVDYEIFIHSKKEIKTSFKKNKERKLDSIPTKWADISLVHASNFLFQTSFNNSCDITYLLSGDSIPTKRSASFCNTNTFTTFKLQNVQYSRQKKFNEKQYNNLSRQAKFFIKKGNWKKQHMFFCINRADFSLIKRFKAIGLLSIDNFSKLKAPDEWFWINTLNTFRSDFKNRNDYLFTGSNLRGPAQTQSKMIKKNDILNDSVNNFIFARKAAELSIEEKLALLV